MIRALLFFVLLFAAVPASADDRTYIVTDFDRIRVEGSYDVRVTIGRRGATARASGEPKVLDTLSVEVQGSTLIVRKGPGQWGEQGKTGGPAPVIILTAPALRTAAVLGGGKLTVDGIVRTMRLDLQVMGSGSIDARGIDADDMSVTMVGAGTVALAGKSARARLTVNGAGVISGLPLTAGDLMVRLDGPGEAQASARYTADLTSTGLGRIVVAGSAKCIVRSQAGGPILCGPGAKP